MCVRGGVLCLNSEPLQLFLSPAAPREADSVPSSPISIRCSRQVREIADDSLGATASAIHLCVRNLLGGLGPLGVAVLADRLDGDLRTAMLSIPACYALSGAMFLVAQGVLLSERDKVKESFEQATM